MRSSEKQRSRSRSRALETVAIAVGLLGLGLAAWVQFAKQLAEPKSAPPTARPAQGTPLNELGAKRSEPRGSGPTAPATPASVGARMPIPQASFDMVAKLEGVAKRENGKLVLDHTDDDEYLRVPMSLLASFDYKPKPHSPGAAQLGIPAPPSSAVPEELLALDGKDAAVVGFMVPIDVDQRRVKEFVLSQNRSFCCYGVKPFLNEMVAVRMKGSTRAPFLKDTPIAVFGELAVSEQREGGYVVSLYRMEASKVSSLVDFGER